MPCCKSFEDNSALLTSSDLALSGRFSEVLFRAFSWMIRSSAGIREEIKLGIGPDQPPYLSARTRHGYALGNLANYLVRSPDLVSTVTAGSSRPPCDNIDGAARFSSWPSGTDEAWICSMISPSNGHNVAPPLEFLMAPARTDAVFWGGGGAECEARAC